MIRSITSRLRSDHSGSREGSSSSSSNYDEETKSFNKTKANCSHLSDDFASNKQHEAGTSQTSGRGSRSTQRNWKDRKENRDDFMHQNSGAGTSQTSGRGSRSTQRNRRDRNENREDFMHQNSAKRGIPRGGAPRDERSRSFQRNSNDYNENRNDSNHRTFTDRQARPMGFKILEELSNNNNSEDLLESLLNKRKGFNFLLQKNDLSGDFIVLIIRILAKVCKSSFVDLKINIYKLVFFKGSFSQQLGKFLSFLPFNSKQDKLKNKHFWNDTDQLWSDLLDVFGDISKSPSFACEVLPALVKCINKTLPDIESEHRIHISDEIKNRFENLLQEVDAITKQLEEKCHKKVDSKVKNDNNGEDDLEPPDDFRLLNIYPIAEEVTTDGNVFLRKNKRSGSYANVQHYLDVQFRLLREDFLAPLRRGISQYIEGASKRIDEIRIHSKIRFLSRENVNELNCVKLQFRFGKPKRQIDYQHSKHFMFGSLVCFTNDKFRTILFGKIVNRDVDMLKNGELVVGFDEEVNINYSSDYIMVESAVFFEPYFHVLSAMQQMDLNAFPMEKYIIYGDSSADIPVYLAEKLIKTNFMYKIENSTTDFAELLESGLKKTFFSFNESQQSAFIAALTNELAVIQGPPGTGKTYLGLKIAHTLLLNKSLWYEHRPILVVCFTNHALDQFLEGILSSTDKIVRIGGQSKNQKLAEYNLRNQKTIRRSEAFFQSQRDLKICLTDLKSLDNLIQQIESFTSVVEFSHFRNIIITEMDAKWFNAIAEIGQESWLFDEILPMNKDSKRLGNGTEVKNIVLNDPEPKDNDDLDITENDGLYDNIFDGIYIYSELNIVTSLTLLRNKLDQINKEINDLGDLSFMPSDDNPLLLSYLEREYLIVELQKVETQFNYLRFQLDRIRNLNLSIFENSIKQLRDIPVVHWQYNDRWNLYAYWLKRYHSILNNKRKVETEEYKKLFKTYTSLRDIEDLKIIGNSLVVGMTTTCAARLRTSLIALKSPIVIIEEAAEVLESHIISALTVECNHLILIGDHQQLQPSTADYQIGKKFGLGVSLFERMVNNDVQCYSLNVQHRMKPEICNLVRPAIYENLQDHETTFDRPAIGGIEKSLYFIHHNQKEDTCEDQTKKNIHEVRFLLNLAKHLILNGYKPENITILAAYLGQMFEMQRERKNMYNLHLKDVKIAVLDNYQGEECDIILLSLVRNNAEGKIGFLNVENRVCVALSRARNGLYVMGNMDMLCAKSPIWSKIKTVLTQQDALGSFLTLKCQIHGKITNVQSEEDFSKTPEGGCDTPCNTELACGHICKNLCHLLDRDHIEYKCREECGKILCANDQHICKKRCYEECGPCKYPVRHTLSCNHDVTLDCYVDKNTYKCMELVSTQLNCDHVADKPCYIKPDDFSCPYPCEVRVEPCGHSCLLKCHVNNDPDHLEYKCEKPCTKSRKGCTKPEDDKDICRFLCFETCEPCVVEVKKHRTICPHVYSVPCNRNVDDIQCIKPCKKIMECGHPCKNQCFESCGPCEAKVKKAVADCGHIIATKCSTPALRKDCKGKCQRKLPCGHACIKKCREECTTQCMETKVCNLLSPCSHFVSSITCFQDLNHNDPQLVKYCTKPCDEKLKCGHKCSGTCGSCFQGRIHTRCLEKCGDLLVCNHECPIPCKETCKPCQKPCSYKCSHSSCKKKCGELCTKCQEECKRRCQHQNCSRKCGDMCDVKPCTEPCPKKLRCNHPCIGFCGDPCPSLCGICNKDELTEIFFGTEDEDDAVFVELQDCKHILESSGMDNWLSEGSNEIQKKFCPKCKTTIINTPRYSDYVKQTVIDIEKVKLKENGTPTENNNIKFELLEKITILQGDRNSTFINKVLERLERRLSESVPKQINKKQTKVRQSINRLILNAINSKIQILERIMETLNAPAVNLYITSENEVLVQLQFILDYLLNNDVEHITNQEIEDMEMEILRLRRIIELYQIKRTGADVQNVQKKIITYSKYSKDLDGNIVKELKNICKSVQISENERKMIVQAVGLAKGHWYKCPNGHPYVITECGGAMEVSKCPECGKEIGGSSHRLLSSNRVATEMDGALRPAWPDQAYNMNNYDLGD